MISKHCPLCGESALMYTPYYSNSGQAQNGRLRLSEVSCQFVLGCEYCSETITVVSDEQVAAFLTALTVKD